MNDQATQLRKAMQGLAVERASVPASFVLPAAGHRGPAPPSLPAPPLPEEHLPQSRATGAVSFAPAPLRPRPRRITAHHPPRLTLAKAIAVSSGKGGVGKSNLAVNLAVAMSRMKLKVCLLDADMGLANADVLCNLTPKLTLEHVVAGKCKLWEAMILAPGGFRLIPGASGVANMADLPESQRRSVIQQLAMLERIADVLIIDTGAGISPNVLSFAAAAHTVIVTTTPEPTAITDGYAMIKTLRHRAPDAKVEMVVNMAANEDEGCSVHARIDRVCKTFLHRPVALGGVIVNDAAVPAAVRQRMPFVLHAPQALSTRAVISLARRMAGADFVTGADQEANKHAKRAGFFHRLSSWLGNADSARANGR